MNIKGIRILDKKNRIVSVELPDILSEIQNGNLLHWCILFLNGTGDLGPGKTIPEFMHHINDSERGLLINWEDLNSLFNKFYEVIDLLLIGCKKERLLVRYENDQKMYETCDITIEMVDSSYWEVFSKDGDLLVRLARKFQQVKFLTTDFEK